MHRIDSQIRRLASIAAEAPAAETMELTVVLNHARNILARKSDIDRLTREVIDAPTVAQVA